MNARLQHGIVPGGDEAIRGRPATKKAGRLRVSLVEVLRDSPGIRHHAITIHQHRHLVVAGEGEAVGLGEAPWHAFEVERLVGQRHAATPAEGAENANGITAAEFVELPCHGSVILYRGGRLAGQQRGRGGAT